jgi:hypothetical protein
MCKQDVPLSERYLMDVLDDRFNPRHPEDMADMIINKFASGQDIPEFTPENQAKISTTNENSARRLNRYRSKFEILEDVKSNPRKFYRPI